MRAGDHAGEQHVEMGCDDLLEGHETPTVGHGDEAREKVGDLHAGEALLADHRIVDHHGKVQREIGDVREGVAGIDGERREHGEDARLEHGREERPIVIVEIGETGEHDVLVGQFGHELIEEHRLGATPLDLETLTDLAQLRLRRAPVGGALAEAGGDLILQTGDADLEELIEVLTEDRDELEAFEQGHRRIRRECEHPGIEVEPGEFTVEESLRRGGLLRRFDRSRGTHSDRAGHRHGGFVGGALGHGGSLQLPVRPDLPTEEGRADAARCGLRPRRGCRDPR